MHAFHVEKDLCTTNNSHNHFVSWTPSMTTVFWHSSLMDATVVVAVRCADAMLKATMAVLGSKPVWLHRNNVQWCSDKHNQWTIEVANGCTLTWRCLVLLFLAACLLMKSRRRRTCAVISGVSSKIANVFVMAPSQWKIMMDNS